MTDERSPLDNALDLLVYAPVGLALTAAEELPKLAAKGRAQVQNQMTIARMVGQFAMAQGRKEIERRLGGGGRTTPPPAGTTRSAAEPATTPPDAAQEGSYERMSGRPDRSEASGRQQTAAAGQPTGADGAAGGSVIDVDFGTGALAVPSAEGLAIPGYDSLSASQVVQRLAGLSQDELAAVGEYEAANRGRRTILTRVGQLKG